MFEILPHRWYFEKLHVGRQIEDLPRNSSRVGNLSRLFAFGRTGLGLESPSIKLHVARRNGVSPTPYRDQKYLWSLYLQDPETSDTSVKTESKRSRKNEGFPSFLRLVKIPFLIIFAKDSQKMTLFYPAKSEVKMTKNYHFKSTKPAKNLWFLIDPKNDL